MYKTFAPRKLSDDVVDHLTGLIVAKQLRPGDRLPPERELAEQFGVSRTVIREAVKMLGEKGLLDSRQGSGTWVREFSSQSISQSFALYVESDINRYLELMDLRGILDVEIVGRLAQSASSEQVAILEEHIGRMNELLDKPADFSEADCAFHLEIYRSMDNTLLMSIVDPIVTLLEAVNLITVESSGGAETSLRRHTLLVKHIADHDAEGARQAMHEIIRGAEGRVREVVRRRTAVGVESTL